MPRPYPLVLRERLLAARAAGLPVAEIEDKFHISRRTLNRWQHRQRTGVGLAPVPAPGRAPRIDRGDDSAMVAMVAAHPDATLAQYCAWWEQEHGVRVSVATMCRHLHRLGLPLKKRP